MYICLFSVPIGVDSVCLYVHRRINARVSRYGKYYRIFVIGQFLSQHDYFVVFPDGDIDIIKASRNGGDGKFRFVAHGFQFFVFSL